MHMGCYTYTTCVLGFRCCNSFLERIPLNYARFLACLSYSPENSWKCLVMKRENLFIYSSIIDFKKLRTIEINLFVLSGLAIYNEVVWKLKMSPFPIFIEDFS